MGVVRVDLYLLDTEGSLEILDLAQCEKVLSARELEHRDRFRHPQMREEYTLSRYWIRTTLSRSRPEIPPDRWDYRIGLQGRPDLVDELAGDPPLKFNLSHTREMMLLGLVTGFELGVDIERENARRDLEGLARRYFSPVENEAFRQLDPAERRTRFYQLWTLKEAYIKALGLGLSIPLDSFSIQVPEPDFEDQSPRIQIGDAPVSAEWQFFYWKPAEGIHASCAVRTPAGTLVQWTIHESECPNSE